MLILFWFLACMYISQCKIIIKDVGVATLTRGDIGMIFYVTLRNIGNYKLNVNVNMVKCCEYFAENDLDCGLMNLLGGDMGVLQPNITKNISLLYPNMYLHNRKGQCLISLKYTAGKDNKFEAKETIGFDTFIEEKNINPVLKGYYNRHEYQKCKTLDEDPLDNCQPIDCHMKYLGNRNFFNHKWRRCQKVPICVADPEKNLPDVSYLPISNMCRDLEDLISVTDLRHLDKGINRGSLESLPDLLTNVHCHHGMLSNETGFCICDDGWMSAPVDKDQYEPSLSIYHMCNIQIDTWNNMNSSKIKMTAILLVVFGGLTTIFIIMFSFICHFLYIYVKPCKRTDEPDKKSPKRTEGSIDIVDMVVMSARTRPSVSAAGKRDSKIFQKKSAGRHKSISESSLPIIETVSPSVDDNSDSSESIELEMRQTESFVPARPKDSASSLTINTQPKKFQKRAHHDHHHDSDETTDATDDSDEEEEQSESFRPNRSKEYSD